ncbi:transcription initiation factor TFIID subunit 12 [Nematocida sp. AWRm77]|nr:transcription initiation factor TFIID subunit 12 [Nematocida sp. AWRm77]
MEEKSPLVPSKKLQSLLALIDKEEKLDKETQLLLSLFTEKFINDVITRAALIAKHKEQSTLTEQEVKFVLETEFDYFITTGRE